MRYLIIPDVHGRSFWKEPVMKALEDDSVEKIIFLGDYLDPYPSDFSKGTDYRKIALDQFKEIIDLKKANPDKIILLQGNHDMEYSIGTDICNCRMDSLRYAGIRKTFLENRDLFQLCYEIKNGDKRFILSHAGVTLEGLKETRMEGFTEDNVVDFLNNKYFLMMHKEIPSEDDFADYLAQCSRYRGGWNKWSSCVWADVREFAYDKPQQFAYQIFGHTYLDVPIRMENFAMLDCGGAAFWLEEDGSIRRVSNGEDITLLTDDDII